VLRALEVWVLQWQPQAPAAVAAVLSAAEAADHPAVLRRPVVVDKRLLRAYSKGHHHSQQEVPARVREGCCTAEQLEPERKDCNNLAVVVHSLGREVSAVAAAAVVVVAAADVAAAAEEDNQQELAVANWSRWVAKHPWVLEEDHRDLVLHVAQDKPDKVALDWVREDLHRDRLVPRSLSLLVPTVGEGTVATLATRCCFNEFRWGLFTRITVDPPTLICW
jgi:hypothetical protein